MPTVIDKPVQVLAWCDGDTGKMISKLIRWERQDYVVKEVGFPHPFRTGIDYVHVFTVNVAQRDAPPVSLGPLDMELHFYSVSKVWKLHQTSDADYR